MCLLLDLFFIIFFTFEIAIKNWFYNYIFNQLKNSYIIKSLPAKPLWLWVLCQSLVQAHFLGVAQQVAERAKSVCS